MSSPMIPDWSESTPTVKTALDAIKDGNWESDYAGKIDNLGLVSEKMCIRDRPNDGTSWMPSGSYLPRDR